MRQLGGYFTPAHKEVPYDYRNYIPIHQDALCHERWLDMCGLIRG